jgi:hypothetical protein
MSGLKRSDITLIKLKKVFPVLSSSAWNARAPARALSVVQCNQTLGFQGTNIFCPIYPTFWRLHAMRTFLSRKI